MTQLALQETPQTAIQQVTPMELIARASANGASIETLQQLFELKLRVEADEARKAFNAAMAEFKAHPPRIEKNKHVKFGNTEYDHATLDNVCDKLTAALSKVGISHKWATKQENGQISVSCVLTHEKGHSETTTLSAGADTSGSKNAIQAIGSAVTYLQRYTLLAATGIATVEDDDGAATGTAPKMPDVEFQEWCDALRQSPNAAVLKENFSKAYKQAEKIGDKDAMTELIAIKDAVKKGLV